MFLSKFSGLGLGAVAAAALLWTAMPVAARGHGGGGGHGGGHGGGGHYAGGHYGGGHYGGGWGRGYGGGWGHYGRGWGWGGFGLGLGLGLGYPGWGGYYGWGYPSYSYYSYPSYDYYNDYYVQPYTYSAPAYSYPSYDAYTYGTPSYAPATAYEGAEESSIATESPNTALLNVRVPNANAQVWIEGQKTNQQGNLREFVSPPLDPNRDYTYHIRAEWQQNGKQVDQTRNVAVHAGDRLTLDFRNATTQPAANTPPSNQTPQTTTPASSTVKAPQTPAQPTTNNSNRGPAVP